MAFGIDYSEARPNHSAMKAAKVQFVIRYIGSTNRTSTRNHKFITPSEYKALRADGFEVPLVFEVEADRADGGRNQGLEDVQITLDELKYLGLPSDYPVYYAVDYDAVVGPKISAYFGALVEKRGLTQIGGYGGYKVIRALFDNSLIYWGMQTLAWSGGKWDSRAQLRQTAINKYVGGQSVDFDESMKTDYGQAPVTEQEENMPLCGKLAPGESVTISIPMGSVKAIGLAYDSPKQAVVRVACHYKDGHGEIFDNVKVGGPASKDDTWPAKAFKSFAHPEKIDWVSIKREDTEPGDGLGWDLGLV